MLSKEGKTKINHTILSSLTHSITHTYTCQSLNNVSHTNKHTDTNLYKFTEVDNKYIEMKVKTKHPIVLTSSNYKRKNEKNSAKQNTNRCSSLFSKT